MGIYPGKELMDLDLRRLRFLEYPTVAERLRHSQILLLSLLQDSGGK